MKGEKMTRCQNPAKMPDVLLVHGGIDGQLASVCYSATKIVLLSLC
jgi:hypothetical protein